MDYVRPLTIASYRSGLPKSKSRHRKADALIQRTIMREILRKGGVQPEAETAKLFTATLGHGVDVGLNPWSEPHYDETSTVDITELLALRFLETFPGNKNPARDPQASKTDDAVPRPLLRSAAIWLRCLPPSAANGHLPRSLVASPP